MFIIGCHLSVSQGYAHAAEDAISIGANTFQIFTRNPRSGRATNLKPDDLADFHALCSQNGIKHLMAHGPYTINLCSPKGQTRNTSRYLLSQGLARLDEVMTGQTYNIHPGARLNQSLEEGITKIASGLNSVLTPEQTDTLLLETMSGKGSEIGSTFEELRAIIDQVELSNHVGVCFDTCHTWDSGYDLVNDLDGVLQHFDDVIGLGRLKGIHLNDSKNECGSHKDRHAPLGEGCIGIEAIARIINHPALRDLPFILETPHDNLEGYAREIALLKELRD